MRNALAHFGKTQWRMVGAATGTVFVQDSAEAAPRISERVANQIRGEFPKPGAPMDDEAAVRGHPSSDPEQSSTSRTIGEAVDFPQTGRPADP